MEPKFLAEKINKEISMWAKDVPKMVVAIDGYTGIGKTTLLNNLVALNANIIPVNRDDFLFSREIVKEKFAKASDHSRVFEFEVCDNKKLEKFVNAYKNSDVLYEVGIFDDISGE